MKNGAQVLIEELEKHEVEYIFGYSGGAALPIFDALYDSKIKLILTRHEQGASHMADGYARASGKPGVVLVTSGPGATNTITGIMTAQMDSVPMIILTGQTMTSLIGLDAFQEADVFGLSMSVVKHNYLVKNSNDIAKVVNEAFCIAQTGRPGPVLIDLPLDVTKGQVTNIAKTDPKDIPGYINHYKIKSNDNDILSIADLINDAQRPFIISGHGILISGASKQLLSIAEKIQIPVATTLLGKGSFPETHNLSLGMLGMYGTAYANKAIIEADLIIGIGCRWDDRIVGDPSNFCLKAKKIHIDIDPAEINKIIIPDAYAIGDAREIIESILPYTYKRKEGEWITRIQQLKEKFPLKYGISENLKAQHVIKTLYEITEGNVIVSTDVGQHQMWAAQYFKINLPNTWLSSGGAGTMGFGLPAAIGAQLSCPDFPVVAIVGDGGFQMTSCELSTAVIHKLPIKILVIDNKNLGMVRQWQEIFLDKRYSGIDLVGNPDFAALAEAYGVKAFKIFNTESCEEILKAAISYNDGPCLIHAEVEKEDNVFPMVPAGKSLDHMILEVPIEKMEIQGST